MREYELLKIENKTEKRMDGFFSSTQPIFVGPLTFSSADAAEKYRHELQQNDPNKDNRYCVYELPI